MTFQTYYPVALKTWLKATPSMIVMTMAATAFVTGLYWVVSHPHDRVERFYFRSNKFERIARKRDEKLRIYYKPEIDWQPNDHQKIVPRRPLLRY